jgi:hypothetical protein
VTDQRMIDVYLDSGICVPLPPGLDPDSDEGATYVKGKARDLLIARLQANDFEITIEAHDDPGIGDCHLCGLVVPTKADGRDHPDYGLVHKTCSDHGDDLA